MYTEHVYKWKNITDDQPKNGDIVDIWIKQRVSKMPGARVADCMCHNEDGLVMFFRSMTTMIVYKHEQYEIWWKPQPGAPEEIINEGKNN